MGMSILGFAAGKRYLEVLASLCFRSGFGLEGSCRSLAADFWFTDLRRDSGTFVFIVRMPCGSKRNM